MSSFLERLAKNIFDRLFSEGIKEIFRRIRKSDKESSKSKQPEVKSDSKKSHPWRLCPIGQHWVHTHPLTVPASDTKPERMTTRRGHCRDNPSRSEFYTADELIEMADRYFNEIANDPEVMPVPYDLEFPNGNEYDALIAGWTKFWNDVLRPKVPASADFVKALIATESGSRFIKEIRLATMARRGD